MPTEHDVAEYEPGVLRILQSKAETRAYYNKIARIYDLLAERSEQPMREMGVAMLSPRSGERLLEIGFGTGHVLVDLARAAGPNGAVFGIDLSDAMVAMTHDLLKREDLTDRVHVTCGDAARTPYADGMFDGIFASFTLELFDTPEIPQTLLEWKRILRPGGRLAVVALSKEGEEGVVMKAFEWTHKHFPNLMDCRAIYVRRAIEAAGFTISKAKRDSMWVPVEIVLGVKP